ncbi:hypothetical protein Gpo141_00000163 [Globisporangium polare]
MALHASPLALKELQELLHFSYDTLLAKLSVREIVALSYEAGGVFPTLLGYAVGAIGTFCFFVVNNAILRLVSVFVPLLFYVQCLQGSDDAASTVLLSFAALIGVACTYVQVQSWKLAFAHIDSKRRERKKANNKSKVAKED